MCDINSPQMNEMKYINCVDARYVINVLRHLNNVNPYQLSIVGKAPYHSVTEYSHPEGP